MCGADQTIPMALGCSTESKTRHIVFASPAHKYVTKGAFRNIARKSRTPRTIACDFDAESDGPLPQAQPANCVLAFSHERHELDIRVSASDSQDEFGAALDYPRIAQELPIELVLDILHTAACLAVRSARTWAVSLALVSKDVYRLIKPVLHHTMVICPSNSDSIARIWCDASCAHVFRAVRRLVISYNPAEKLLSGDEAINPFDTPFIQNLLTSLQEVDAPFRVIEALASVPTFRPLRLGVRFKSFDDIGTGENNTFLETVTHLEGYWENVYNDEETARDWAQAILSAAPSLTHLAIDIVDFQPNDYDDPDVGMRIDHAPVVPDDLTLALQTILQCKRIQCVAFYIAGERVQDMPIVADVVRSLDCASKVRVWLDERPMVTWEDETQVSAEDAWAGRNVWTEAKPLEL
ncbi:hypothetical protein EXIGLDRAFT_750140 [Exidia glandulosa HHB12029]|uniref:Uncharacterized protein n=1 Tax=Exidia glandulosa HHB12029 TaxID=1314781 RepID=A0A166AFC8_EXIGL|nr:hypothetical protein EXIGLDRAFT_750140 [Exidia glandulosa HHB12029]